MPGQAEFDRAAVITIQGGGIYGLSLLGQLGTEREIRASFERQGGASESLARLVQTRIS